MKYNTVLTLIDRLNRDAFANLIELPRVAFTRSTRYHGWTDESVIKINPRDHADTVAETLYHELLHLFIDTVLEAHDDDDHGLIFRAWYVRLLPSYIVPDDSYV